jgi:predicted dehydrogenase
MSTKRTLNIGLVGCGFMGRTHSNAFAKVNQFFELDAQPVLKAVCAPNPETAKAFAGLRKFRDGLAQSRAPGGHRPHRYREP